MPREKTVTGWATGSAASLPGMSLRFFYCPPISYVASSDCVNNFCFLFPRRFANVTSHSWKLSLLSLICDQWYKLSSFFQMLVSLAALCKDFIRQRVCKDAFPAFLTSLRSQALVSCHAGPVYSHTLGFKLQKALLDGLGTLCVDLALGESLRAKWSVCPLFNKS